MKILIIGAGLTGATLAYNHIKNKDKVLIIDKRNHIGGNIYTEFINDIHVHKYGAHIFHTSDKEIWNFINMFGEFNNYRHCVKSKHLNKYYSLPINLHTYNEFFDITNPTEITKNHTDIIINTLFKNYTAKQWNINITEINPDILKRLSIRNNYNNNYFDDIYEGIPIKGYTDLINNMLIGSSIILNKELSKDFDYSKYDIVYNTGCIDKFMNYCLGDLKYRSLLFETIEVPINIYQGCSVINEADSHIKYTRTIEHKHFCKSKNTKTTIITREYPISYNKTNEPYYCINDKNSNNLYNEYINIVKQKYPNMIFCGRLGSYKYYDMDDAIKEALKLFNKYK